MPPVLAVEVAGDEQGDEESDLLEKARWYLGVGVEVSWIVLPIGRNVIVVTKGGQQRLGAGERLPEDPALPGLSVSVDDLFIQVTRRS